jgi:hypothetical protein
MVLWCWELVGRGPVRYDPRTTRGISDFPQKNIYKTNFHIRFFSYITNRVITGPGEFWTLMQIIYIPPLRK